MRQVLTYCSVALLTLVGCSSDPSASTDQTRDFLGEVALDSCGGEPQPKLVRCGGDAAPGVIAAVCGDLEAESTVTVNGSLAVSGASYFAASLRVSSCFTGFERIRADGSQDIAGDLSTGGDWLVNSSARVGGNANVGGKLDAQSAVAVRGVLHAKDVDMTNVSASTVAAAIRSNNPLYCDLAPAPATTLSRLAAVPSLDLGAALSAHSRSARVQLGCENYRFDSFGIDSELSLHVKGHTVIVVDGDVRIAAPTIVELESDAKLDFVIRGSLSVDNRLSFSGGSTWLTVGGDIRLAAPMQLDGVLSAPGSTVSSSGASADATLKVTGALLVRALRIASPLTVEASADPPLPACVPSQSH